MTAIKSQHSRVFDQHLAAHRQTLVDSLATGTPQDYPAYRQIVGQIQGIDDAVKISEEADFKISGDEPDGVS